MPNGQSQNQPSVNPVNPNAPSLEMGPALVKSGMAMIAGGMAQDQSLSPMGAQALADLGSNIANRMQDRWWKHEFENFQQTTGAQLVASGSQLMQEYNERLAEVAKIKDVQMRGQEMNQIHGWAVEQMSQLDQQFFDAAGSNPNNPYIGNAAQQLWQMRRSHLQQLMGGRAEAANIAKTEAQTELYSAQAEEAQARASVAGKSNLELAMDKVAGLPDEVRLDVLMGVEGGPELLQARMRDLQGELEQGMARDYGQYKQAVASGDVATQQAFAREFEQKYFAHPDDLVDEEGELDVEQWIQSHYTELRDEALDRMTRAWALTNPEQARRRGLLPEESQLGGRVPTIAGGEPRVSPQLRETEEVTPGVTTPEEQMTSERMVEVARSAGVQPTARMTPEETIQQAQTAYEQAYNTVEDYFTMRKQEAPPPIQMTAVANQLERTGKSYADIVNVPSRVPPSPQDKRKWERDFSNRVAKVMSIPSDASDRDDIVAYNLLVLAREFAQRTGQSASIPQLIETAMVNQYEAEFGEKPESSKRKPRSGLDIGVEAAQKVVRQMSKQERKEIIKDLDTDRRQDDFKSPKQLREEIRLVDELVFMEENPKDREQLKERRQELIDKLNEYEPPPSLTSTGIVGEQVERGARAIGRTALGIGRKISEAGKEKRAAQKKRLIGE